MGQKFTYTLVFGSIAFKLFNLCQKFQVAFHKLPVTALVGGRKSRPKRSVESVLNYFIQKTLKQNNKSENEST